jgi:hypothetical protein
MKLERMLAFSSTVWSQQPEAVQITTAFPRTFTTNRVRSSNPPTAGRRRTRWDPVHFSPRGRHLHASASSRSPTRFLYPRSRAVETRSVRKQVSLQEPTRRPLPTGAGRTLFDSRNNRFDSTAGPLDLRALVRSSPPDRLSLLVMLFAFISAFKQGFMRVSPTW